MQEFFLEIISTSKVDKITDLEWLEVVSPSGSFVVMLGHAPVLSLVSPGHSLIYKKKQSNDEGQAMQFDSSAIFSFIDGHAKVLIC